MINASAAHLWSATERIHKLQAPRSGHADPGKSELPNEWCGKGQVACIDMHTCIDKFESKNMYWKSCREHMHTEADKEAVSKVDKATPVISWTNIKLIKLIKPNKAEFKQNQSYKLRPQLHESNTLKE